MPVTWIGTPPLIAAPAHTWQTLLTVLMQASPEYHNKGCRSDISLNMGLYQPAKKLQMARQDLKHIILCPGELHIVTAQLRIIRAFTENSGLDLCWIELQLYGPATVKQIIDGKNIKRGETAHMITLQHYFNKIQARSAVLRSWQSSFVIRESMGLKNNWKRYTTNSFKTSSYCKLLRKWKCLLLSKTRFLCLKLCVSIWEWQRRCCPLPTLLDQETERLLKALKIFTKYFFAHGMLIHVYLAEMQMLHESDPEIYGEFKQGNCVVDRSSCIPFCAAGPDNNLEHVNRSLKVSGGQAGIMSKTNACTKYFLIAPKLARLPEQAKQVAGSSSRTSTCKHHHTLTTAVRLLQERHFEQLTITIRSFTNPFLEEHSDLFNLVTKVVMPKEVKRDICQQSVIGKLLYGNFAKERIQSREYSIWSLIKKCKLLMWRLCNWSPKTKWLSWRKIAHVLHGWWWSARQALRLASRKLLGSMSSP